MRAHNLCPSTFVMEPRQDNLQGFEYETTEWEENGHVSSFRFVTNRKGVMPLILEELAAARKAAKKDMAEAKDPFSKSLFNGRQNAYKVVSNSLYGSLGASRGMLPCKPIAACVTTIGRGMIAKTKEIVENAYPGAEVIYGDTDSVFVKFGATDMHEVFRLGKEAAEMVTKTFIRPIE